LPTGGLHDLAASVEREERRLARRRGDPDLTADQQRDLEAAQELKAPTLVAILSGLDALDALVEHLAPAVHGLAIEARVRERIEHTAGNELDASGSVGDEARGQLRVAVAAELRRTLPAPGRPKGTTVQRWEEPLAAAGLGPRASRALPDDFSETLQELIALRHVIVRRQAARTPRRCARRRRWPTPRTNSSASAVRIIGVTRRRCGLTARRSSRD
jgi:hypothetical protein